MEDTLEQVKEAELVVESNTDGIEQTAMQVVSAGYTYIYDTVTGDRSITNNNMLPAQLKKKRPDGTTRFTMIKPPFEPKRGIYKCLLHADSPNREHYDGLGLPVCKKHNLTNPFQVRRHMEKRHPMEWKAIDQERAEKEKQDDRDFQRGLINMAVGRKEEVKEEPKEEAPLYVSDKEKKSIKR